MNDLSVGDTVYADFSMYGRILVKQGIVTKITPTGRVNVDFGGTYPGDGSPIIYQFKGGFEIGGDKWNPVALIPKDRYDQGIVEMKKQSITADISARLRKMSLGDKAQIKADLQALLDLADTLPEDA